MPILTIPDPASISKPRNDLSGNVHICGPFGEQAQGESHHCLATRTEKRKPSTRGISIKYVRLYHVLSCFYLCSYHLDVLHHGMLVCLPKGHLICKIVDRWMKPYFMQPHWRAKLNELCWHSHTSDSPHPSAREGADRPLKTSASGTQPNHACPDHSPNSRRLQRHSVDMFNPELYLSIAIIPLFVHIIPYPMCNWSNIMYV